MNILYVAVPFAAFVLFAVALAYAAIAAPGTPKS
jgi:hypothetical protein